MFPSFGFLVGAGIGAILVFMLFTTIVITGQQTVRMIETFGKFSRVAHAGLSFKAPWPIQSASGEFSMQVQEIAESVGVMSMDRAFVSVPIRVQFRVMDGSENLAFYKLSNPAAQIRSYIVNQVRSTASGMTFDELFRSRDKFNADVMEMLTERMASFGFQIDNVLVDDPQPSDELKAAFDRVISAERLKEAAQSEGEAARIMAVAKANAEGESLRIKAQAFADFRNLVAEGNATALNAFVEGTGLSPAEGLTFFTSLNEMEAVRDAAHEGTVVFVTGSAGKSADLTPALMGMAQTDRKPAPKRVSVPAVKKTAA